MYASVGHGRGAAGGRSELAGDANCPPTTARAGLRRGVAGPDSWPPTNPGRGRTQQECHNPGLGLPTPTVPDTAEITTVPPVSAGPASRPVSVT
jgi:hypothetical protein